MNRVSDWRQFVCVERQREERGLAMKDEIPGNADGVRICCHQLRFLAGAKRSDEHGAARDVGRPREVGVAAPVGQKGRPVVAGLRFFDGRDGFGLAAFGRHAQQPLGRSEENRALAVPRAADEPRRFGDVLGRAARCIHAPRLPQWPRVRRRQIPSGALRADVPQARVDAVWRLPDSRDRPAHVPAGGGGRRRHRRRTSGRARLMMTLMA